MKTIKKYKHFLPVVVYGIFYLKCFQYLETHITKGYHLSHTPFDDMIPFCEFLRFLILCGLDILHGQSFISASATRTAENIIS